MIVTVADINDLFWSLRPAKRYSSRTTLIWLLGSQD
jgi:hypothetical protein